MNQTRFYIVENNVSTVRVHLFVGGLPPHLSPGEYTNILKDELTIKSKSQAVTESTYLWIFVYLLILFTF